MKRWNWPLILSQLLLCLFAAGAMYLALTAPHP